MAENHHDLFVDLMRLANEFSLNRVYAKFGSLELNIERTQGRKSLTRLIEKIEQPPPQPQRPERAQNTPIIQPAVNPDDEQAPEKEEVVDDDRFFTLKAPIQGVFYRRPAPHEPPYKVEGDPVNPGDVIGLIEIMKLYHSITVDISGVLIKFLVKDGEVLAQGQPLALIEIARDNTAKPHRGESDEVLTSQQPQAEGLS